MSHHLAEAEMCDVDLSPAFQEPQPMVLSDFSRRGSWNQEQGHVLRLTARLEKMSGSTKLQAQRKTGHQGLWRSPYHPVCLKEREVT